MSAVIFWSIIFSITTAASVTLLGSRDFIDGPMSVLRMIHIIFNWKFIIGAILAFGSRLLFIMTNNAIANIPHLASSSTTITAIVNLSAILFIVLANYYFLGERINFIQGVGTITILIGIFLITR